ncbi:MAG: DUF4136 domain-containing protein [Verrucomicrobia bacterium]|nr:MAG: DUF4136 domain-containing protein [Verrucomicrobiota bacterium]
MRMIRIMVLAAACFSGLAPAQKVTTQYSRSANVSQFHTYKWITITGSSAPSQITAENIVNVINAQLAQKGLVQTTANADLLVGYQTSINQQQQMNWFNDGGPWVGGFGQATTSTIDVGTLVVDMYDPTQKQLIWRGTATKTLNPSSNPDKNYKNLERAVSKLLKDFPPKIKN